MAKSWGIVIPHTYFVEDGTKMEIPSEIYLSLSNKLHSFSFSLEEKLNDLCQTKQKSSRSKVVVAEDILPSLLPFAWK